MQRKLTSSQSTSISQVQFLFLKSLVTLTIKWEAPLRWWNLNQHLLMMTTMMKMMRTMHLVLAPIIIHMHQQHLKWRMYLKDCSSLVLLLRDSRKSRIKISCHLMLGQVHIQCKMLLEGRERCVHIWCLFRAQIKDLWLKHLLLNNQVQVLISRKQ